MATSVATTTTARPAAASAAARARASLLAKPGLLIAAALSMGAGLVHLQVTETHWFTWWGYGLFFLLSGVGQVAYAAVLMKWPNALVLWAGILGNLGIVGLYGFTRTNGIPTGPSAGHIERVGSGDFITTAGEFFMVALLVAALGKRQRSWFMTGCALAGLVIWYMRLKNVVY